MQKTSQGKLAQVLAGEMRDPSMRMKLQKTTVTSSNLRASLQASPPKVQSTATFFPSAAPQSDIKTEPSEDSDFPGEEAGNGSPALHNYLYYPPGEFCCFFLYPFFYLILLQHRLQIASKIWNIFLHLIRS